ncbi:MAG: glycosyltransferase family 39 protein [Saprospiraceae bacterium]
MRRDYLLVFGLAILFFFPFLGAVHLFDQYEVNSAECAREMLVTGEWVRPQIGFQPYWDSPPMFIWSQAISMQVFGVNEFAARFPNAICGLITLLLVFRLGSRLHDRMFAWIWVLAWLGSLLPHFYFRSGMIDPWFNLLVFCGLYGFIEFRWQFLTAKAPATFWQKYKYMIVGGGLLGMAIMTMGFMAYVIVMLVLGLYWARYRFRGKGYLKHLALFTAAAWAIALVWIGIGAALHGADFIRHFTNSQIRHFSISGEHASGFWGNQALILLLGCFPASVFALPNLWGDKQSTDELLESNTLAACMRSDLVTWMQLLFWVGFLLISLTRSDAVHYSSLCFFPLTYLGSVTIWRAVRWDVQPRITGYLLPVIGVFWGLVALFLPSLERQLEFAGRFFAKDVFTLAAKASGIEWGVAQMAPGLIMAGASVAGWYFWKNNRPWMSAQAAFSGGALFTALSSLFIFCQIEEHTQRAAIEFYESRCDQECHITPVGFKSYAPFFYARQKPGSEPARVFFVARTSDLCGLPQTPGCRELYRKEGFVFFECLSVPSVLPAGE